MSKGKPGVMLVDAQRTWRCYTVDNSNNLNGVFTTDDEKQKNRFIRNVTKKGQKVYVSEYVLICSNSY